MFVTGFRLLYFTTDAAIDVSDWPEMRLINTTTLLFEEFLGRNIPKYAILSHTWEDEEVSFKDMETGGAAAKQGYRKIEMTCQIARDAKLDHAWVDTCCIDKSSSAELSEAINSMFRWYQRAEVCFAYLSDLPASPSSNDGLVNCRWFKRGFTLQELIAPTNLSFFDVEWILRGSKTDLVDDLSNVTGVPKEVLLHEQALSTIAAAAKMSWAAHRECARIEDIAYSLLGIFDLNMPLLYGEEERAFRRLQEEIIKTNDLSILAWKLPPEAVDERSSSEGRIFCGVLAGSPSAFSSCRRVVRQSQNTQRQIFISSLGITATLRVYLLTRSGMTRQQYILPLGCLFSRQSCAIRLKKCGPDQFLREDPRRLVFYQPEEVTFTPSVERHLLSQVPASLGFPPGLAFVSSRAVANIRTFGLQVQSVPGLTFWDMWSGGRYDAEDNLFFVNQGGTGLSAIAGVLLDSRLPNDYSGTRLECVFLAVGRSRLAQTVDQQFSLVKYREFSKAVDDLRAGMKTLEYSSAEFLRQIIRCGIPKSPSAIFAIPQSELSVVISFTVAMVSNENLCSGPVWKIDLSCDTYRNEEIAEVGGQQWTQGDSFRASSQNHSSFR